MPCYAVRPENVPLSNASLPRGLRLPTWPVNASRSLPHCRPGAGGMGVGPPVAVGFEWPGFMQRSSEQAPAQHKYWYSGKCRIHIVIILCSWQRQRPPLRPPPRRPSRVASPIELAYYPILLYILSDSSIVSPASFVASPYSSQLHPTVHATLRHMWEGMLRGLVGGSPIRRVES
jgi:hypothetical protein